MTRLSLLTVVLAAVVAAPVKGAACWGDADLSGEVDVRDMLLVLANWGCPWGCWGDIDGVMGVDAGDLEQVFLYWGPCPYLEDPGLAFAAEVLTAEAGRFIVSRGHVDDQYFDQLWDGNWDPADGSVEILPAVGYPGDADVNGLMAALLDAHEYTFSPEPLPLPSDYALPGTDHYGTVYSKPIALTPDGWDGPYVRLKYELVFTPHEGFVRVTSEHIDGDVTRFACMDFRIGKEVPYTIISPSRLTIDRKVLVEGVASLRYGVVPGELDGDEADPLVMCGDFFGLDDELDMQLDTLYQQVADHDVNGDNRLSTADADEAAGLEGHPELADHDGNGFVDDFDLFLARYDADADGSVVLPDEFGGVDDELATLIDGFMSEPDGVLDAADQYAKVHGRLEFAVSRAEWESAHGASYHTVVRGPIVGEPPVVFEAGDPHLPEITADTFRDAVSGYKTRVSDDPTDFISQVADGLANGGQYVPGGHGIYWEAFPYGAPDAWDYYDRPVFVNMRFEDARIPRGTNALFTNCLFVGVTFIETYEDCVHENWNYAGALERVRDHTGEFTYEPRFPGVTAEAAGVNIPDTKLYSNNIRFDDCTFVGTLSGDVPGEHTHWRNHVRFTGNTRFFIEPDDPDLLAQPDAEQLLAEIMATDHDELRKSSMVLPGWPVSFVNNAVEPSGFTLRGTIVAGTLDLPGPAAVAGRLVTTFRPVAGEGPLFYGGGPWEFRSTIGGAGAVTVREDPDVPWIDGVAGPLCVHPMMYY